MLTKFTTRVSLLLLSLAIYSGTNAQQINAYAQVYSANLKGGTTVFGNTSMNIVNGSNVIQTALMNETPNANGVVATGNDNNNMQFADIDGVAATKNSTSANLVLPAGTNTIKFARLYWGGRIDNAAQTTDPDTLRKAKIRFGASAYSPILAPAASVDVFAITATDKTYQTYVDVTSYLQANGSGTYTVADIAATPGSVSGGGKYAGWSIVVAYENTASLLNSVRIYHGYYQIQSNSTLSVTLNGLNVPNNSLAAGDAVMSTMAWEGDGNLGASAGNTAGDYMKVNGTTVSNAVNPATNFWNGSISKTGTAVTTKNPNYLNQMGIDIDEVNVGTGFGILPNATSVTLTFGSEADQYFPSYFAFALRVKDPLVTIAKTVADANSNNTLESNEILTYTLSGKNIGPGVAYNVSIVDTLPTNVTYVANSMQVISGPGAVLGNQTDAVDAADFSSKGTNAGKTYVKFFMGTGATNAAGGSMQVNEAYSVKFQVQGQLIPGSVSNTATSYAYSLANDLFTDISTAVIGPSGGPLSVKLTSFSAVLQNNDGLLRWVTESETNNNYFEVERSDDGVHFSSRGKVYGNGTTGLVHAYTYTDPLNTTSKIVYYRLKDTDKDGRFGYSTIVAIRLNGAATVVNKYSVYPNPFITDIKVAISSASNQLGTFRVITLNGKEILNRKITIQAGDNIVVLKDFGTLATGSYILEVTTATDKFVNKIIKN
ncbi:MAG: T9SS type A sorting domain-containing protein [Ferruginibacter sp.]